MASFLTRGVPTLPKNRAVTKMSIMTVIESPSSPFPRFAVTAKRGNEDEMMVMVIVMKV
jgi:hypothetical protein